MGFDYALEGEQYLAARIPGPPSNNYYYSKTTHCHNSPFRSLTRGFKVGSLARSPSIRIRMCNSLVAGYALRRVKRCHFRRAEASSQESWSKVSIVQLMRWESRWPFSLSQVCKQESSRSPTSPGRRLLCVKANLSTFREAALSLGARRDLL